MDDPPLPISSYASSARELPSPAPGAPVLPMPCLLYPEYSAP